MLLKFFLFNPLVKLYLNVKLPLLDSNKRVKAVALEMWFFLSMFIPWFFVLMIPQMLTFGQGSKDILWPEMLGTFIYDVMMVMLVNKDFFNGQSAVHRKIGFQVVDAKTGQPATQLKCMVRNITAPLWMVEMIFLFANPDRRLGDFIAGTRLIKVSPSDPELVLTEISNTPLNNNGRLTILISIIWVALLTILFTP
ncbi:MAG TPA: RDD family protein, partial [Cyclobacteriaceae bacterium]|nr:RDD family protein [Cyclobacteriaceae bacterium]